MGYEIYCEQCGTYHQPQTACPYKPFRLIPRNPMTAETNDIDHAFFYAEIDRLHLVIRELEHRIDFLTNSVNAISRGLEPCE